MKQNTATDAPLLCPSAKPEMDGSVIFGVVGGTAEKPHLAHLAEPQPVTDELLALSGSVTPTEIFRFAAPCATKQCQHFDGSNCRLVTKIVQFLPEVTAQLSSCHLRSTCRWWQQEGKTACIRCPQIVSETYYPSEQLRRAASPAIADKN